MTENSKIAIGTIIGAAVDTAASYRKQDGGKALANSPFQSDCDIRFGKTDNRTDTLLPLSKQRKAVLDIASSANTDEASDLIRRYLVAKAVHDLSTLNSDQLVALVMLESLLDNGHDVAGLVNESIVVSARSNTETMLNNVTNEDLANFVKTFKAVWSKWYNYPVADDDDTPASIAKPGSLFTTRK